ncbi:MAG: AAA family ATPase [Flavobacteriaceae bacterium]|nr:AAA family ATPase [Flavobacteriaceae bacterium]
MKILIFGASGSRTTTLAKEIENKTNFKHLDVDDYYWKKTKPPFQEKIPLNKRNDNLKADFEKFENVIVSGSMVSWGKEWETSFDLAIFIYLNNTVRIQRLENRETERYGEKLLTNKTMQRDSKAFLKWANQYENPNFTGRSLKIHNDWIALLKCDILRIDGGVELKDKMEIILTKIVFLRNLISQNNNP